MASLAYPEATLAHQAFILSLDVGTSSVRALLFDLTGTAVQPTQVQHSADQCGGDRYFLA